MLSRALVTLSCAAALAACAVEPTESEAPDDEDLEIAGQALGASCDPATVPFSVTATSKYQVHPMPSEYTWHKANACLKQLLSAAEKESPVGAAHERLYAQTLYLLSNPNVRFYEKGKNDPRKLKHIVNASGTPVLGKLNRLVYWNEHEIAYDSMSQVDFGLWLLKAHRVFLKHEGTLTERGRLFRDLGLAALGVITDLTQDGGLRSRSECAGRKGECSWFHSVTQRDLAQTTAGATLNKCLHPVRDLYEAADVLAEVDPKDDTVSHAQRIASLRQASLEGTYQLVYGKGSDGKGSPPNLFDFIATTPKGAPIQRSWLYYGFNPGNGKPHFLGNKGNDWKNCGYHMHVMELLSAILPRLPENAREGFTKVRPALGRSVVDFIVEAYELKLADGLGVESKTKANGRFGSCGVKANDPPSAVVIAALDGL